MNLPIFIAALVEDPRRGCSCGAVGQQLYGLCRDCRAAATWRRETARSSHRAAHRSTHARTEKAELFARMASLFQIISKGAES